MLSHSLKLFFIFATKIENMKDICTSPKQSERLVKLGLDIKTADMYYIVSEDVYSFHYALRAETHFVHEIA